MRSFIAWLTLLSLSFAMPIDIEEEIDILEKKSVAVIVKIEGKAKVLSKKSIKKHKAELGEALFEGDTLITYVDTRVLVELDDCSSVILNESSELSFTDVKNLKQASGEVYYKIKTRKSSQGLKVETPFSIMGIKGTEFIVDARGKGEIALNEGLVGIESLYANFELHKAKVMAEYKRFKDEQNTAFEAYKTELAGETISYVKEFDLEAGKSLHFDDAENCQEACESQVSEKEISEDFKKRFEMYKEMIE